MTSHLLQIRDRAAAHLRSRHELRGVRILIEDESSLENRLDRQLSPLEPLAVTLLAPEPWQTAPATLGPRYSDIRMRVLVQENLLSEPTRRRAVPVAEFIVRKLHGWNPPLGWLTAPLLVPEEFGWDRRADRTGSRHDIVLTFMTTGTLPTIANLN